MTLKNIIVATTNPGKIRELRELFNEMPFVVQSLTDVAWTETILENGDTFEANALIKARTIYQKHGGYVLADDSGLECDDLQGSPGVYSARFAGDQATDSENNARLIAEIAKIPHPTRQARYVCVLALITPDGQEHVVRETCEGLITMMPAGGAGFGYDPYFYLPQFHRTMAEITPDIKNKISHRGKAMRELRGMLCLSPNK